LHKDVLLVEADEAVGTSIRDALCASQRQPFHVEWVKTCADAVQRLAAPGSTNGAGPPAIAAILVDLQLPDGQGLATFDRLFAASSQVPIVVLSTVADEVTAQSAVERGAHDYILTDHLDGFMLPRTLSGMLERAAAMEALFAEKERAEVTLNSIGDAVMCTDVEGRVTYLNVVAENLTGWSLAEAAGRRLDEVFRIIDATTRKTVANPMARATQDNSTVALTPNCVLIRRDGVESAIEDSAAPIHDRRGLVTGAVMVFHDVSTARALSERMAHLAQHDSMTDLPNRSLLNDRLAQALALARRHREKLAVLFLDLDRFKHINDSMGHAIGDGLLISVAARLVKCIRTSDTVSRQGGDEFVVVLGEILCAEDAGICAAKVLASLSEPHIIEGREVNVTASIGIVLYPDDGQEPATLLKNADFAMYQAKDRGRNGYQFYEASLNSDAFARQRISEDLRGALRRREFELFYQPNVDVTDGTIVGVEALIRWRHPQRGLVLPGQFISIAEDSGLIVPIGRWVLGEACRQAAVWRAAGLPPVRIAVNISAAELLAPDFVDGVRTVLAETGLDPGRLELELTETALMRDTESVADVLRALKRLGVSLALDDFGTGYSSLTHMRRFPIDALKVDQSFVRDLATDADDASVVSAVIDMGRNLHMRVVAEGVETRAQLAFLEHQGCREAQGFFFGRPVAPAECAALLGRGAVAVQML
jgi:diguanylate cyclase (GGDEF)-like protein/PAS domain S-box-containing protein